MDELKAYEVLGLERGASREEIKEAYVRLSKEYHPEEYPEEFQQIHEAYRLLGRAARTTRRSEALRDEDTDTVKWVEVESDIREKPQSVKITFEEEETAEKENYDFEETLYKAKQSEAERLHEKVLRAEAEFHLLIQPAYRKKVKLFTAFFKKEEHQEALRSREFVGKLAVLIEESVLKKKVYRDIVSFYRLQDKDPENLVPEGQALYHALSQKVEIKESTSVAAGVLPVGILGGLWAGLRASARLYEVVGMVMLFVAFLVGGVWIYAKCREKRSHVFAQIFTIIYINIILFIAYVCEIWTSVVGGEDMMLSIVVNILLVSCGWLVVLFFYTIVKMVKSRIKKS